MTVQCNIKLKQWSFGTGRIIGEVEVDLAPFITKTDGKIRLPIPKCELPNTVIEAEIKLTETTDAQTEDESGDEDHKEDSSQLQQEDRQSEYQASNDEEVTKLRQEIQSLQHKLKEQVTIAEQAHASQKNYDSQIDSLTKERD